MIAVSLANTGPKASATTRSPFVVGRRETRRRSCGTGARDQAGAFETIGQLGSRALVER
jgi:hypothetical protein